IWYGLAISFVLIITRLLCTLGASLFTRFMSRFITVAVANPGWKLPLIHGWAGIRGVVSLAAALSIPLIISEGKEFPYRNLILFITFIVILVTLVLQGLTLPWLIRILKVNELKGSLSEYEQEKMLQKKITQFSIHHIEEEFSKEGFQNEHLENLHSRLKIELDLLTAEFPQATELDQNSIYEFQKHYLSLLEHQRKLLDDINHYSEYDEGIIRKYQSLIDLEEYKIREKFTTIPDVL
ncbi:MAG TPA: cation:proton antiporter, partial [Saprospiraceae bacterium]|nr:cation:proton antiporter [Saprospiraceae bacterium]